jgi:RNA polymerase sigma-70 factor, ECF subfamily
LVREDVSSIDLKLAMAAKNDREAAGHLLERVYPRINQVVYSAVGPGDLARDLVQTCLLEVMESLSSYRGTGALESWAGQLAYRVVMRKLKKQRSWERCLNPVVGDRHPDTGHNPEAVVARRKVSRQIFELLMKIPGKRRTILVMHVVEQYTAPEIAELTCLSIHTVKDRLRVGLRELREMFSKNQELKQLVSGGWP